MEQLCEPHCPREPVFFYSCSQLQLVFERHLCVVSRSWNATHKNVKMFVFWPFLKYYLTLCRRKSIPGKMKKYGCACTATTRKSHLLQFQTVFSPGVLPSIPFTATGYLGYTTVVQNSRDAKHGRVWCCARLGSSFITCKQKRWILVATVPCADSYISVVYKEHLQWCNGWFCHRTDLLGKTGRWQLLEYNVRSTLHGIACYSLGHCWSITTTNASSGAWLGSRGSSLTVWLLHCKWCACGLRDLHNLYLHGSANITFYVAQTSVPGSFILAEWCGQEPAECFCISHCHREHIFFNHTDIHCLRHLFGCVLQFQSCASRNWWIALQLLHYSSFCESMRKAGTAVHFSVSTVRNCVWIYTQLCRIFQNTFCHMVVSLLPWRRFLPFSQDNYWCPISGHI